MESWTVTSTHWACDSQFCTVISQHAMYAMCHMVCVFLYHLAMMNFELCVSVTILL